MPRLPADSGDRVRRALAALTAAQGFPPSVRQIAAVVGLSATRAHAILRREEEAGRVTHDPRAYRSWRLTQAAST